MNWGTSGIKGHMYLRLNVDFRYIYHQELGAFR